MEFRTRAEHFLTLSDLIDRTRIINLIPVTRRAFVTDTYSAKK